MNAFNFNNFLALFALLSLVAVYVFKIDKKIVFYYAKKGKRWAKDAAIRMYNDVKIKEAVNKKRNLNRAKRLADELSEANGNRRYYVLETNQGGYRVFSRREYNAWMKIHGLKLKNTNLIKDAVYFTK